MAEVPRVGAAVKRIDAGAKVSGTARYIDDLHFPEMLHGATIRSPLPRGRIVAIHFDEGIPWEEFTIVSAADIPGANCISIVMDDQPCLAEFYVNHAEEPVLLIAHPDRCLIEKARRAIHIEVTPLPALLTMEDSLAGKEIIWGNHNTFKHFQIEKGNVDTVWGSADLIVEGEYSTGAQEQLYLETNGMIATAVRGESVTVWGSMQCPYYVHHALKKVFALDDQHVRVIQTETGGGFGGKEEYPSMIAAHAALLAWKSQKPVKLIYDRSEDMAATTKRHPALVRHKTAVTAEGKLLAMEIEFTIDGGAYATLTPVVLSRGGIHAAGPYECPNVRVRCRAIATNTPPHGAFRGFGVPQTAFALEVHMDKVAAALGLSPDEVRRRNFLRKGQTTATGQQIREDVDMGKLLDRALSECDYHNKRARFARENAGSRIKRGIGLAAFFHGAGFTGSGERYLASVAAVEVSADGIVHILTSSTDMGQGTKTVLAQIVADRLRLPLDQVVVEQPDTHVVPDSGPTVASRTCMIVGKLVEKAALDLKKILQSSGQLAPEYDSQDFCRACAAYIRDHGHLKASARYEPPPQLAWDDDNYTGDAYGTFAWAVYVAEVSIDTATYETRVEDFVAAQEVGRVINPTLAVGQIEGGVAQGIGFALYENVCWQQGRMANCQLTNYIIPTARDLPRIRVLFDEVPYAHGPMGAKGIGELPIDGPAPAVVNAIENALGVRITSLPATPEVLLQAELAAQTAEVLEMSHF